MLPQFVFPFCAPLAESHVTKSPESTMPAFSKLPAIFVVVAMLVASVSARQASCGFVAPSKTCGMRSVRALSARKQQLAVAPRQQQGVVTFAQWGEDEDEYFATIQDKMTAEEKMKDPLVLIGLFSIFVPFILLAIAYGAGWVGN